MAITDYWRRQVQGLIVIRRSDATQTARAEKSLLIHLLGGSESEEDGIVCRLRDKVSSFNPPEGKAEGRFTHALSPLNFGSKPT